MFVSMLDTQYARGFAFEMDFWVSADDHLEISIAVMRDGEVWWTTGIDTFDGSEVKEWLDGFNRVHDTEFVLPEKEV